MMRMVLSFLAPDPASTVACRRSAVAKLLVVGAACTMLAGCANVKPWERGDLARPEMQLAGNPGLEKALAKTFSAKEAANGGAGVGGGGCGCN